MNHIDEIYVISSAVDVCTSHSEKKKRKEKTNFYICREQTTTKTVKIEKQNSIKLSTLRFSVPFTFSTNKNVGAAFFIMSHQWWWYARNKNATKITDQFHQALNAYLHTYTHTFALPDTVFQFYVFGCWCGT